MYNNVQFDFQVFGPQWATGAQSVASLCLHPVARESTFIVQPLVKTIARWTRESYRAIGKIWNL